jgi:glyoxylase-like metal-dependent hydrolase (beta-lactamase superfamily II)
MVCHCLLLEAAGGLVLIDTGLGTDDVAAPRERLGRAFVAVTRPVLREAETAIAQIRRLGFSPSDVRHILVTHLDLDHAGGLPDFQDAQVHVFEDEHHAAMQPTLRERARYRPAHFAHGPRWVLHRPPPGGERWMGFEHVRDLPGLPPDVLIVPVTGHTRGHSAIAVRQGERWLLHCGDAYFHEGEMDPRGRRCSPGLDLFQRLVQIDGAARWQNQERLRELARDHGDRVRVFCAHDPSELSRFTDTPRPGDVTA